MEITITKKEALEILDDFDQHREELNSPNDGLSSAIFEINGRFYRFKHEDGTDDRARVFGDVVTCIEVDIEHRVTDVTE